MSKKCCFYERGTSDRYHVCTTDPNCPTLTGWNLTGSWGVADCVDCFGSTEPPPPPQPEVGRVLTDKELLDFATITKLAKWIIENWEKIHPGREGLPEDIIG